MSKLTHESKDGRHIFTKDLCSFSVAADELAELVTAAQAALAKQNSGVMGGCVCSKKASPVCSGFFGGKGLRCLTVIRQGCAVGEHSFVCDHDEACHQPQAQRREA